MLVRRVIARLSTLQGASLPIFPTLEQTFERYARSSEQDFPQDASLVNYSIIPDNDKDRRRVQLKINNPESLALRESKAIGCFVGSVIGDALGTATEGLKYDKTRNLITDFESISTHRAQLNQITLGQYSDDSAMAHCVADSLIVNKLSLDLVDLRHRFFLWWCRGYNNGRKSDAQAQTSQGAGITVRSSFTQFMQSRAGQVPKVEEFTRQNSGNASLMRIAPIPIAYQNHPDDALDVARDQSYATHNGSEVADCCRLLAFVAIKLLHADRNDAEGVKLALSDLSDFIPQTPAMKAMAASQREKDFAFYQGSLYDKTLDDRNWAWKDANWDYSLFRQKEQHQKVGVYACDCLAMALHIVYHSKNYKDAVIRAVNLGGDADTVSAVTGMLAGAYYGFTPEMSELYRYVQRWDDSETALKAYKLFILGAPEFQAGGGDD